MDGSTRKPEGDGEHIWLRYATQFTMNGRNVTVEMGIPVPLGANAETRERLIREAEEGMEQLSNHIEGRIGQMVQRIQQGHATKPASARPATNAAPVTAAPTPPAPLPARPSTPAQPAGQTPSAPPTPIRETTPAAQERETAVPPSRPSLGASIPGDTGGTLSLPQFIQIIRETLSLTPKQAMDLLKVKSLSGLNYRDALEDLQHAVATEPPDMPAPTPLQQRPREDNAPRNSERSNPSPASARPAQNQPTQSAQSTPSNVVPISKKAPFEEISHAVIRETPPDYPAFDEELDDDEITFGDEEPAYPELTQQERETAEEVLNRLKEARGSSVANAVRLKALNNVIGGQISDEQLQQLIHGVWNIPAVNKLKNDQVEALIYWGKSDDFIGEAELVLALLAEGDYARSDR